MINNLCRLLVCCLRCIERGGDWVKQSQSPLSLSLSGWLKFCSTSIFTATFLSTPFLHYSSYLFFSRSLIYITTTKPTSSSQSHIIHTLFYLSLRVTFFGH
ncbi:hypothetical protein RJT34_10881 [Clitoria ternatea]|uniref:Uncharacterized protein n=1 Tax=Clitoria ternatea TaxID=43366 RepID=A0AAN9PJI3_CLITE